MQIGYRSRRIEIALIIANAVLAALVVSTFVLLFGFARPLLPARLLYTVQLLLLAGFTGEKLVRRYNAVSRRDFWRIHWIEVPLLAALLVIVGVAVLFAGRKGEARVVQHLAVGIYLVVQVVTKICRSTVNMAATGGNPARTMLVSFVVLIVCGAGLLMLPKAVTKERLGSIDALFTATSATCVTGLAVKNTGQDFSLMGQVVILALMQLGGLGIVVFGAVLALLLRQAFSVRESVAMQDLLSSGTISHIGQMIAFVFTATVLIEALGATTLYGMWDNVAGWSAGDQQRWFWSIFHSISAFCNCGLGLLGDSLMRYSRCWQVYLVICPLIVLGGLGFSVLVDLASIVADRTKRLCRKYTVRQYLFSVESPKKMRLQTKIVLVTTAGLIVGGMLAILLFEFTSGRTPDGSSPKPDVLGALFQSVTARTAGFNTVDIAGLSEASKFVLILLMFVGGSPGSTAGGIKTVTLAVIVMTVIAALRRRSAVEIFRRSIRISIVGRALTVALLYTLVLFIGGLALSATESAGGFSLLDIAFEATSALGTVGLSTGVTPYLTTAGKLIIISMMLIGRLGPLTLMAALTFNLKPVRYNYPEEAVIVG